MSEPNLAGAGAQVTEAAIEAATDTLLVGMWVAGERADVKQAAYAALSAAAPHMGTGQSEADLRARISALADEWDVIASQGSSFTPKYRIDELRALLDRPAAEGDNA